MRDRKVLFSILCLVPALLTVSAAMAAPKYSEAPSLAALVKEGKLPPVEKRLPVNPLVVKETETGVYGGTWRMATKGAGDDALFTRIFGYDQLVSWSKNWDAVVPNIAEKWTINKNATEYTITLRKGLKWSDGEPFTSDDMVFWYEDIIKNPDLGGIPNWIRSGDKPAVLTKINETTFKFTFEKPFGLFEQYLASVGALSMLMYPAHYCKQFLPKYADKARLDEAIKAAGFTTWLELFTAKVASGNGGGGSGPWSVKGRPTMLAWVIEEPLSTNATQIVLVRNPYYFKVDGNGQQYPYIDKLVCTVYQDVPAMLLKAVNGEIDFQMRHFNTLDNKAVLAQNREKGHYSFFDLTDAANNKLVIQFNLTHKDPAMRKIFQDRNFRIGMSYAINRQQIIDTVYVSQGKPAQPAPLEGSPFYSRKLATQYIEYDAAKANQFLDKVLPKKDENGMRLRPDGQPFAFVFEISNANKSEVDAGNMIVKFWKAVGVNAEAKPEERTLLYTRKDANDLDSMVWQGEGGYNPIMDARYYFPASGESAFAEAWQAWYNGGKSVADGGIAEEPPKDVKAIMAKFDAVKTAAGFTAQVKIMNELLAMSADQFFVLGIMTPPDQYGIYKNNMRNVMKRMINSWAYPTPGPLHTFAYFFQ